MLALCLLSLLLTAADSEANSSQTAGATPVAPKFDLSAKLCPLLRDWGLRHAKVGVYVVRLRDGAAVFDHHSDALLVPASNVKIVTAAAALAGLGPDYTFTTEVYGRLQKDGVVASDLLVVGHGDPFLVPERLYHLATRLKVAGVTRIAGNLVMDDSYFAGFRLAEGFEEDKTHSAYMAPAGALSAGFNALLIHVLPSVQAQQPARVLLDPPSNYAAVEGQVQTVSRGRSAVFVDVVQRGSRDVVQVRGHLRAGDHPRSFWRRVNQPARYTGEILRTTLQQVGIQVAGEVTEGAMPPDCLPRLHTHTSPRLAELVGPLNKYSNNFIAAQIANTLGAVRFGVPGTWEKGRAAIGEFLQTAVGLDKDAYRLGNASGLHEVNRFSAKQIATLIQTMHAQPRLWPEFLNSLAVAGGTGTLQDRMVASRAAGLLRGKTGTLAGASALSGYVTDQDGEAYAFSILVNSYRSLEGAWRAQDRLGAALAEIQQATPAGLPGPALP